MLVCNVVAHNRDNLPDDPRSEQKENVRRHQRGAWQFCGAFSLSVSAKDYERFFFRDDLREEVGSVRLVFGLLDELKNSI